MSDASIAGLVWLGIFAFMIFIEVTTVGLTAVWFAVGALVSSVLAFAGISLPWQAIIFLAVSLVMMFVLRPLAKRRMMPEVVATNADSLIGEVYPVLNTIGPGHEAGQLKIGDVEWRAISEDGSEIKEGTPVVIRKIEGTKLIVLPK